jgi:hypothetical protein
MIATLLAAEAAFTRGDIGEREFLAIGLAINDELRRRDPLAAAISEKAIRDRLAELDAAVS